MTHKISAYAYIASDILLEKGYAKPYFGGKKNEWTDEELDHIVEGLQ